MHSTMKIKSTLAIGQMGNCNVEGNSLKLAFSTTINSQYAKQKLFIMLYILLVKTFFSFSYFCHHIHNYHWIKLVFKHYLSLLFVLNINPLNQNPNRFIVTLSLSILEVKTKFWIVQPSEHGLLPWRPPIKSYCLVLCLNQTDKPIKLFMQNILQCRKEQSAKFEWKMSKTFELLETNE